MFKAGIRINSYDLEQEEEKKRRRREGYILIYIQNPWVTIVLITRLEKPYFVRLLIKL